MSVVRDAESRIRREIERSSDVYFVQFEYGDGRPFLCPLYALLLPQDRKLLRLLKDKDGMPVMAELKFRGRWRPIMMAWKQTKSRNADSALSEAIPNLGLFEVIKEAKDETH